MPPRQSAQLDLDLPEEVLAGPPASPPERSRRPLAAREARHARPGRLRVWIAAVALAGMALLASLIFYQVDQFLASDPRFTLAERSGLRFEGGVHVSPAKLRQVFAGDFGRSVYLIPLEARRRALLAVDWVREARVERHWPSRIVVRLVERTPVAFVLLPSGPGAPARTALIDAEGVILDAPPRADFTFPVLLGITSAQPPSLRRERVALFLSFLRGAGSAANQISEVDLTDPENLKITALVEGNPVRLLLGNANFRARLDNFQSNYAEIRRLLPHATAFDLRLDRHITAMKGAGRGR
jgi:cell division protein FtsQ